MNELSDDRFHELSRLLSAYESTDEIFDDTMEASGRALKSYLRTVARTPDRAAAAVCEIDDLLEVGLSATRSPTMWTFCRTSQLPGKCASRTVSGAFLTT
jgi:hypothetical protein